MYGCVKESQRVGVGGRRRFVEREEEEQEDRKCVRTQE